MKLFGNIVLIKPDNPPARTNKGLLLSPTAMDRYVKGKAMGGVIIDHGPICKSVKKDQRVLFSARSASVIVIDNRDYYMIGEDRLTFIPE